MAVKRITCPKVFSLNELRLFKCRSPPFKAETRCAAETRVNQFRCALSAQWPRIKLPITR